MLQRTRRGILVLIGAVLIHLTLGVLYCFGNFSSYIVSYLKFRTGFHDIKYTNTQWIFTLMVIGQGSSMYFGGLLEKRIGSRLTILIGCIVHTCSTALGYFAIRNFYLLILSYGLFFGFGVGIAYSPTMTLAIKWLPAFKGIVAGSVVAGFGLGAMVFNPIITVYINPNNTHPSYQPDFPKNNESYFHDPEDKAILDRVPTCFLVMASFFCGLQLIGNLLLREAPTAEYTVFTTQAETSEADSYQSPPSVQSSRESLVDQGTEEEEEVPSLKPGQVLRTLDFWVMWFGFLMNNQGISYVSTYWKVVGSEFIQDDLFLAAIGSAGSIANALSRIVWGGIGDWAGYKVAMGCLQFLFATLLIVMNFVHVKWGYAVFVFCLFFCIGGSFSLLPTATVKRFGLHYSTSNYGLVFTSGACGALLNVLVLNILTTGLSYQHVQWIMGGFLFTGFTATMFFRFKGCGWKTNEYARLTQG